MSKRRIVLALALATVFFVPPVALSAVIDMPPDVLFVIGLMWGVLVGTCAWPVWFAEREREERIRRWDSSH